MPEAWLTGPVAGVSPLLQPVAHALMNALEQMKEALEGLDSAQLSMRPGGAASIAYHVTHAAGSLDRLFTYARGESLSDAQRAALKSESRVESRNATEAELVEEFERAVERAMAQLRNTSEQVLLEQRGVGRAQLPSTVLGLLFHGGEHTARHAGQIVTTARIVRANPV
jgi:uncharacterized damage-inducible protein DinB